MRFGFFDQLPCPPGFSEHQRYQAILAQIELGDVVGFDTAWLGELHFSRGFSILADPLMVLAAAAQRTSRIRLGTAVTLLPMHNPVKIAEEAAIADILSDGRLELGVGRGTAPQHYAGYGIPQEESRERFDEALDFIIGAWTHESFSFEGKYYLLDWKTNYLGPSDEDYTQENMAAAMHHHQYDLQASIYAEALKRYVKLFDNSDFSSCFGGAFYYFVRGKAVYHFMPT